ncbi:GNAT family N-acetyltransferase [Nocardioides cynanchi]|uniref:GNAT family N-acetyltransferase n=1 Tax=Nocardioides cynanchi TaxID=2558918 RepID=UPI001248F60A|nr:GNAT family N-acetyltransferase [Nocardioides cynanchi]
MSEVRSGTSAFRVAGPDDAVALTGLERDANLVALAHVFPGVPYPEDEVLARWSRVLADPEVRVEVCGPDVLLDAYVCWDPTTLRHLAVRPERWGTGLGRLAVERAVGATRLWCLVENRRARGLYEHLGWSPTGRDGAAEWPPYPREMEYAR